MNFIPSSLDESMLLMSLLYVFPKWSSKKKMVREREIIYGNQYLYKHNIYMHKTLHVCFGQEIVNISIPVSFSFTCLVTARGSQEKCAEHHGLLPAFSNCVGAATWCAFTNLLQNPI